MKELFLVVWIVLDWCFPSIPNCPDHIIDSKIVSSPDEAAQIYQEHKETARVFKIYPAERM